MREQYAHAIDMVPTVLDVLGIEPPATIRGVPQSPLHGVSLAHTFDDAGGRQPAHDAVLRDDGPPVDLPRRLARGVPVAGPVVRRGRQGLRRADLRREARASSTPPGWELYHVAEDPAECHDLAGEHRDRLIALIATWYVEAGKYDVMPVDGSGVARMAVEKPLIAAPRDRFVYYPGTQSVPFFAGARVLNRPHSITADVEIPEDGAEGVLLAQGTAAGGFTFYVKDGRLHYTHNWVARELLHVASDAELSAGQARAALRVRADRHSPTPPRATGARAACSSTSTASSSATARSRTPRRSCSTPAR